MFKTKTAPALAREELTAPLEAQYIKDLIIADRGGSKGGVDPEAPWGGPGGFADPSSNRIVGTDNDDTIYGTERRDVIEAKDGNDTVYALGGDDVVFGGRDDDVIHGGDGNDWLSGGSGRDSLYAGGDGWQNILNGGPGVDRLHGSEFVGVQDIFQFTLASDSVSHPDTDTILGFRKGEDKIHLAFDSDDFKPGHQSDFHFVDEEDAGTAGTMWIEGFYGDFGTGVSYTSFFRLYGHTNNDGVPDFEIVFQDNFNDNEDDWWNGVQYPDDLISINDFIF